MASNKDRFKNHCLKKYGPLVLCSQITVGLGCSYLFARPEQASIGDDYAPANDDGEKELERVRRGLEKTLQWIERQRFVDAKVSFNRAQRAYSELSDIALSHPDVLELGEYVEKVESELHRAYAAEQDRQKRIKFSELMTMTNDLEQQLQSHQRRVQVPPSDEELSHIEGLLYRLEDLSTELAEHTDLAQYDEVSAKHRSLRANIKQLHQELAHYHRLATQIGTIDVHITKYRERSDKSADEVSDTQVDDASVEPGMSLREAYQGCVDAVSQARKESFYNSQWIFLFQGESLQTRELARSCRATLRTLR